MLLCLFRHGIAIDHTDLACPEESERFLTEKGRRRTRLAVEGLRALGVSPELVISSPWTRALQTAELVMEALEPSETQLLFDEDLLPMSPPRKILHRLADHDVNEVMLVGHAPHLDLLLDELCGGARREYLTKAGAAYMELDPHDPTHGVLRWALPSKELRALAAR